MNDPIEDNSIMTEAFVSAFIQRNKARIIIALTALLISGAVIEIRSSISKSHQEKAQAKLEAYLKSPSEEITRELQAKYPNYIQTQLVSLLEAKEQYPYAKPLTEKHLSFVINNAEDEALRNLAIVRLSMVYKEAGDLDRAQAIYQFVNQPTSYTKLNYALTLPNHTEEKEQALDEALAASESVYMQQLISIAHYNNIDKT